MGRGVGEGGPLTPAEAGACYTADAAEPGILAPVTQILFPYTRRPFCETKPTLGGRPSCETKPTLLPPSGRRVCETKPTLGGRAAVLRNKAKPRLGPWRP